MFRTHQQFTATVIVAIDTLDGGVEVNEITRFRKVVGSISNPFDEFVFITGAHTAGSARLEIRRICVVSTVTVSPVNNTVLGFCRPDACKNAQAWASAFAALTSLSLVSARLAKLRREPLKVLETGCLSVDFSSSPDDSTLSFLHL